MSLLSDRGLFRADFTDHHAVLGVSVEAEIKDIRKRYLKIARQLHPDSAAKTNPDTQKLAESLLSKMVNPAWERLSQEKERTDYLVVLKLKGQAAGQQANLDLSSEMAKQLLSAANPDHFYQTSLSDLATKQYEQLDQALELTAQISELNMVYLMRRETKGDGPRSEPKKAIYTGQNVPDPAQSPPRTASAAASAAPPPKPVDQRVSLEDQYYRRAEDCVTRGNFAQAVLELRDALKINPSSSRCHSLMGFVYFKQNQGTMAKIHFNKALESDSQNDMALKGLAALNKLQGTTGQAGGKSADGKSTGGKSTGGKSAGGKPGSSNSAKPKKPDDKSGGGGLFGLFGKKK
jgi:curved DNA-binding protein CbpA